MSSGTEVPKRPVQRLCRCTEGKRLAEEARETNFGGPRPPSASRQPAGGVGSLATPGTTQAVPAVQAVAPAQTTTNGVGLDRFGRGSCFSVWPFVKKGAKVAPGAGGVRGAAGTGPRPFACRQTRNFPGIRSSRPPEFDWGSRTEPGPPLSLDSAGSPLGVAEALGVRSQASPGPARGLAALGLRPPLAVL